MVPIIIIRENFPGILRAVNLVNVHFSFSAKGEEITCITLPDETWLERLPVFEEELITKLLGDCMVGRRSTPLHFFVKQRCGFDKSCRELIATFSSFNRTIIAFL